MKTQKQKAIIKNQYIPEDEITYYDIWFHKSDYLPYKMRSKWYHSTYIEECKDPKFNTNLEKIFVASNYFPEDFEIIQIKKAVRKKEKSFIGKRAPNWMLKDLEGNSIGLENLKRTGWRDLFLWPSPGWKTGLVGERFF